MPTAGSSPDSNAAAAATRNGLPCRLDAIDRHIIRELQSSSKITNAALAQRIGISAPSTVERIRKLESAGVITGYVALVSPAAVNQSVQALVYVSLITHTSAALDKAKAALSQFEEVMACWHTAGDEDFVLKVIVPDMAHYESFVSQKLSTVPNLGRIRTAFVLSTIKHTTCVPVNSDGALESIDRPRTSRRGRHK